MAIVIVEVANSLTQLLPSPTHMDIMLPEAEVLCSCGFDCFPPHASLRQAGLPIGNQPGCVCGGPTGRIADFVAAPAFVTMETYLWLPCLSLLWKPAGPSPSMGTFPACPPESSLASLIISKWSLRFPNWLSCCCL